MYLITLLTFAVLNLNGVEPGGVLGRFGNSGEKDAWAEANHLFMETLVPSDFSDNDMAFGAARRALGQLRVHSDGKEKVISILQDYSNLEEVAERLKSNTVDCNNAEVVDQFYRLHELMSTNNNKFRSLFYGFYLSSLLNELKGAYLSYCGVKLSAQLRDIVRSDKEIDGIRLNDAFGLMSYFPLFFDGLNQETSGYIQKMLSGKHRKAVRDKKKWLNFHSSLEGLVDVSRMASDYNTISVKEIATEKLFEKTCGLIEKDESFVKLADILLKIMKMTDRPREDFLCDEPIIVDYQICLEARKVFLSKELDIHKNEVLATTSGNKD